MSALTNSTSCGLLMLPGKSRKQKFQQVTPAMGASGCQVKLYGSTGVCPLGAQVRTRVGRSLNPDSSMRTTVRPSRRAFFEQGPAFGLPLGDGGLVALQRLSIPMPRRRRASIFF